MKNKDIAELREYFDIETVNAYLAIGWILITMKTGQFGEQGQVKNCYIIARPKGKTKPNNSVGLISIADQHEALLIEESTERLDRKLRKGKSR